MPEGGMVRKSLFQGHQAQVLNGYTLPNGSTEPNLGPVNSFEGNKGGQSTSNYEANIFKDM